MRIEDIKFDRVELTSQGFLVADANLTRSGVFDYHDDKGNPIRELRPAEEVFSKESLDSLKFAPLTKHHPNEMVTADNIKKFQIGMVGENIEKRGDFVHGKIVITDPKEIEDILNKRDKGESIELSMGYDAEVVDVSGDHHKDGKFDKTQRKIRYNHASVVDKGRAGREVKIIMDAEREASVVLDAKDIDQDKYDAIMKDQERPAQTIIVSKELAKTLIAAQSIAKEFLKKGQSIKKSEETGTSFRFRQIDPIKFKEGTFRTFNVPGKKGVSLVFGTLKDSKNDNREEYMKFKKDGVEVGKFRMDAIEGTIHEDAKDVVERLSGKLDEAIAIIKTQIADAEIAGKSTDELQAKFDQLESDSKDVKVKLDELSNPNSETIQNMIKERADLETVAGKLDIKVDKEDGTKKSNKELKVDSIVAVSKDFKADDKSDDYIGARFDAIVDAINANDDGKTKASIGSFLKDAKDPAKTGKKNPRQEFMDKSVNMHKTEDK